MKLARTDYTHQDAPRFPCRAVGCIRAPIESSDGFVLPFCKLHTEKLTRKLFDELVAVARFSPFDSLGVGKAERAVVAALRHLAGARRQG